MADELRRLVVEPTADRPRLDRWLAAQLPGLSRARLQSLIEQGHVELDGAPARASARLRAGQQVAVRIPAPTAATPRPQDIPLTVVHEDAHLVVVDKAAGLSVHPGAGRAEGTLVNALLFRVRDLSGVGGVLRPGIVHRLDRGTSGLMVVAKDDATHRALAAQFAERTVEKEYLAVVLGVPKPRRGRVSTAIGRHPVQRKRMAVRERGGRAALTVYTLEEALDGAALLRVRIHTGRTHQIRVHLASIGHPVAGDREYGGSRTPPSRRARSRDLLAAQRRPALHAARLAFTHPATGERVEFASPLPPDVRELVEGLRASGTA